MEKVRMHFKGREAVGFRKIYPTWPGVKITFKQYIEGVNETFGCDVKDYFYPDCSLLNHSELSKMYSVYCRDMKELKEWAKKDKGIKDAINGKGDWTYYLDTTP